MRSIVIALFLLCIASVSLGGCYTTGHAVGEATGEVEESVEDVGEGFEEGRAEGKYD